MQPNTHPKTGIAFGVIDASQLPELYDEIITQGTDNALIMAETDIKNSLLSALEGIASDFKGEFTDENKDNIISEMKNRLVAALDHNNAKKLIENIDEHELFYELQEHGDAEKLDMDDILECLIDAGMHDNFDSDINNYSYEFSDENGTTKLQLIGSPALIFINESPYTANCRWCSPCCPNAGDLNSPEPHGITAYCLKEMPKDWEGKVELLDEETRAKHLVTDTK